MKEIRKEIRILWVDDDAGRVRSSLAPKLQELLHPHAYADIRVHHDTLGVRELIEDTRPELIILDLEFMNQLDRGATLADDLRGRGIQIPVIFITNHRRKVNLGRHGAGQSQILGEFDKSSEGLRLAAVVILDFMARPPISMILFSDIHCGVWATSEDTYESRMEVLENELRSLAVETKPDYMMIAGDMVWQGRNDDFARAGEVLRRFRAALQIGNPGQVHFCPGNHDYQRTGEGWSGFRNFVRSMAADDPSIRSRYSDAGGHIDSFQSGSAVMGVSQGTTANLVVASLNTTMGDGTRHEIGQRQLLSFRRRMQQMPKVEGQLRVLLMHHPLLSVPGYTDEEDEHSILDSTTVLNACWHVGVNLVIHGHAHYSAITEMEISVLNTPAGALGMGRKRMVVISLPSLGGQAHGHTPVQQYSILYIGHFDPVSARRNVDLRTRIFDPRSRCYTDGDRATFGVGG